MGLIMKNGELYSGSGSSASNISYDSTVSGLPASTVQSAIDYLNENGIGKADTEGIIVNVEIGNWIEQSDGTFTNTITVSEVTAKDIYDVSLYGDFSEEQAEAFDFLVSSIDTLNGKVVLTASEKINVALSIILRGKVNLEDKNVYVSDLSATSIEYDNTKSGLDATNMQNAMDEIATMVNGLVVNVTADGWNLQNDGTYKKTILIEQITGKETLDVCLYPGDVHSEEQIVAFSELITSIETGEGMITLIAVEKINVSFRMFLYGKVNFDKNNLVALTDNYIDIVPISEEEFNKKSDAEKAAGNYLVDDGEDDDYLSARNMSFDGSEIGMEADNVHDAISELNSNLDIFMNLTLDEATPLAVCKYIRENIDKTRMLTQGFHFNAVVNNVDFFSGHIYSDNGDMYWGTIQQRTDSIDNSQIYKYFSSGGADTVSPFSSGITFDNWVLKATYSSNGGPDSGDYNDNRIYTVQEAGRYVAIYAFGGYGTQKAGSSFLTTTGKLLHSISSGNDSGYVNLIKIFFTEMSVGDTFKFAYPIQNNSRGTGLVYKIN